MISIKFLFFFALAIACVLAFPAPEEFARVKKQVLVGGYTYPSYSGYAAPLAYSAGYSAYPYGVGAYYY